MPASMVSDLDAVRAKDSMFSGLAGFTHRADLPELAEIRLQVAEKLVVEAEGESEGAGQRIRQDMNRWFWARVQSVVPFLSEDVQDDWRRQCAEQPDYMSYAADLIERVLELSVLTDAERQDFWQQAQPTEAIVTALALERVRIRKAARMAQKAAA